VLLPSQLLSGIKDQSGTWVVGAAAGTVMTGAYSRALGLASKTSEAGYRVGEVLLPGLVERSQPDDSSGAELLARTLRICAVPLALLVAGAGGAATGVLQVFGEGFDRANIALALLFGAYSLAVLTSVQSQWFLADGKPGKVMRMSLVSSAVSLALVLPLGLRYEADGVAFALLMGPAVEFVLFDRALGRELRSSNSLLGARVIGGTALAVAAGYTAAWGVQRLGTSLLWTATALGAGAGAAVLVVLAAGLVQRDERAAAVALAGRLRR
jgi:O-antigen/teichoic acid export membrane protein